MVKMDDCDRFPKIKNLVKNFVSVKIHPLLAEPLDSDFQINELSEKIG